MSLNPGLCFDARCLDHAATGKLAPEFAEWLDEPAWENAERVRRAMTVLDRAGVTARCTAIAAREATDDELGLVHMAAHLARFHEVAGRCGELGEDVDLGPGSGRAALLAVGGLLACVDATLGGEIAGAYALLRPPGHHATAGEAMGFCPLNAVAVAARHAQRRHGIERVAIIDWDVHHGNGTQAIFWEDPSVLFASIHQDGLYPAGSGALAERGAGAGEGTTINVPLPAGCADAAYLEALERIVLPAVRAFAPELILVSAGQDPAAYDPLGRMSVTTEGFRALAAATRRVAGEVCGGHVVGYQEGGYSLAHMPFCTLAVVEGLFGLPATFDADPVPADVVQGTTPQARAALDAAFAVHGGPP